MKTNFISGLLLLSILALFGCSEDNTNEQPDNEAGVKVILLSESGEVMSSEIVTTDLNLTASVQQNRNPNQMATGEYGVSSGNQYTFSAVENNGGVHGELDIQRLDVGAVHATTICVTTIGDEAVAFYLVDSVEFPASVWAENIILGIKYKDNGEGANTVDEASYYILVYPNWFNTYATVEDFLAVTNCNTEFENPDFTDTGYINALGQIQVR